MADIKNVFRFKNDFQITNLMNKLNLDPMQLCDFVQIIAEGYDINETRERVLDYVARTDFDSYVYVRKLLTETEEPKEINLNQLLELKDLIEEISRKMSANLHNQLIELFNKKANSNIANTFFMWCKEYETNKDINIDLAANIDGRNIALSIYNLKNDIKSLADAEVKEEKTIKECFKLPENRKRINSTSIDKLEKLKEEYKNSLYTTNDESYQELLYEANLKLNTAKMLKNNKLNEAISNNKKISMWINNIGCVILNPTNNNKWNMIHYNNTLTNIPSNKLLEFVNSLNKNIICENNEDKNKENQARALRCLQIWADHNEGKLSIDTIPPARAWEGLTKEQRDKVIDLNKRYHTYDEPVYWDGDTTADFVHEELDKLGVGDMMDDESVNLFRDEISETKEYTDTISDFVMDIQDMVNPDQKHLGIKQIEEVSKDFEDELEETTCAGAVAGISKPLFTKTRECKESKELKHIKNIMENFDDFSATLKNKNIDYSERNGIQVFVDGVIANVHTKEDALKLFEMIDNKEDISSYLYEGLSIEDIRFLMEDGNTVSDGISTPNNPDEQKPDVNPEYNKKKEELANMADTGNSNISVDIADDTGIKKASDDYDILGLEDNDDSGKASSALVKNRNTGETITVDPHDINIKA